MSKGMKISLVRTAAIICLLPSIHLHLQAAQSTEKSVADSPDGDVEEFRVSALESKLTTMPSGPERNYFEGVLANRTGHLNDSIRLLGEALPHLREGHRARAARALELLADDYNKTFRYAEADQTFGDLLVHFGAELHGDELKGTKDDAGVAHLLRGAPGQTISWQGPVKLKTERNVINSLVTELTINGVEEKWLLDTGANLSVVSRSLARRLNLKPLPGFAQTMSGLTGIENPLQVALIPVFQMGGATLQNVVVLILDDANLNLKLPTGNYQINGIVGYPVFQSLGAITFRHDGVFEAGPTQTSASGARMYMRLLTPVIECDVQGIELPFTFDTGATGTILSIRYFRRFGAEARGWKEGENVTAGGGGAIKRKVYVQPELDLKIGKKVATIRNVPVFPAKTGADLDELYGNLGQDVVAGFESFTLDFSKMTFTLGNPLQGATRGE